MWLLQSDEAFDGRKLWLRPGKTYLFGRTVSEVGQLAISHNTISRKHLTITVDNVQPGHAYNLSSRSGVTIEDLKTKIGTVVNGQKIKGAQFVVDVDEVEITMGKCPSKFLLSWNPVIFTFSFTKKELQTQPLTTLQDRFENLDIKLLTEYSAKYTTHVVSKKRNTAKGLQALINGKYIVTETFLDAVVAAAATPEGGDGSENGALEQDYDESWPDPIKHLPPRGGEPVQHPDETYSPDPERQEVFEGYTFIFYDNAQYDNLLAPITNGGGKAFLEKVDAGETEVDTFVQRVKGLAGEQDLGDGGKGVVLVRFVPIKGDQVPWYTDFFTAVSLRLDHRPIEQSEFLEAILIKDASILRRPLEVDDSTTTQPPQPEESAQPEPAHSNSNAASQDEPQVVQESRPPARRGRTRTAVKRRFAGFDNDSDIEMGDTPSVPPTESNATPQEEQGLFMSQEPEVSQEPSEPTRGKRSQRKRSPPHQDDDMGDIAPAAARFKRQRLERGDHFASPSPEPEPEPEPEPVKPQKKFKKELDVLAVAAQHREQEEARARAEKEDLAHLPDDIDLSQIRKLQIVEKMAVREPSSTERNRELDIADGRWNPKWNGMKNFKKFRRRGEIAGRAPAKVIISLAEVKNKEFGIGDDYWLENESQQKKKNNSQPSGSESHPSGPPAEVSAPRAKRIVMSESEDDEDPEPTEKSSSSQRQTRTSQRQSELATQSSRGTRQSQSKRPAPEPPKAQPAKRPRQARKIIEIADSDSDDDLKFRFGKRR